MDKGKLTAKGMLRIGTPTEDWSKEFGLFVKREDLSCPEPGPPFSKTRGVFARVKVREEKIIGVLDTAHSQAGHAVARACQILGKKCLNFYPVYKKEGTPTKEGHKLRPAQQSALDLGARMKPLQAGRSCILFHAAKKRTEAIGGYMMPNALKLEESVGETAKEVDRATTNTDFSQIIIPISSGTIAAGVIKGFLDKGWEGKFLIHMGYSRSHEEVVRYLENQSGHSNINLVLIDEGFSYKDKAKGSVIPPWPCNVYYDLKAFQWWYGHREDFEGETLFWNIG